MTSTDGDLHPAESTSAARHDIPRAQSSARLTSKDQAESAMSVSSSASSSATTVKVPASTNASNSNNHSSLAPSAHSSITASPRSSRDSSPAGKNNKHKTQDPPSAIRRSRSRPSSHDISPSHTPNSSNSATVPSAAAIQRALSSATPHQLQPSAVTDPASRIPRPQRTSAGTSGENTPHWPVSPRLKSPPPSSGSRRNSLLTQRKPEPGPSAPSIFIQSSTPNTLSPPVSLLGGNNDAAADQEEQASQSMKPSARTASAIQPTLETVQEGSLPATPSVETASLTGLMLSKPSEVARNGDSTPAGTESMESSKESIQKVPESGSDSGGNKSESRGRRKADGSAQNRLKTVVPKTSFSRLQTAKARSAEPAARNMTVETETVSSIPQATIPSGQGDRSANGGGDGNATIRLKPSSETIRPKKDRKRSVRKTPSVASGTASSKADVFEAKVASAVDEANSSDSEETFVYESNPPDSQSRPGRHHSRTPSATSVQSMADQRSFVRSIGSILDAGRGVHGKRSMKFSNNSYTHSALGTDGTDRFEGVRTVRSNGGTGSIHHHHIGRYGRNGTGLSQPGYFDAGSNLGHNQNTHGRGNLSRHSSRPSSPKHYSHHLRLNTGSAKKNAEHSSYDIDLEGADDERTPLVGTVRTQRVRTPRRPNSASFRRLDMYQEQHRSLFGRFAGCFAFTFMILLVILGALGFLLATTKPLYGVHIRRIENVLASEQELMFDVMVEAINPNVVTITVSDIDVNVFAKSTHVGSERYWREHGAPYPPDSSESRRLQRRAPTGSSSSTKRQSQDIHVGGGVDKGTDPIPDPEGDSQTMLLGRIFHLDSPLSFDGSAFKRHAQYSVGQLRLGKPGNKTEIGGSERWERVLEHHFDLIVRGVLKYQLPLSNRIHSAPISATRLVLPDDELGGVGREQPPSDGKVYDDLGE